MARPALTPASMKRISKSLAPLRIETCHVDEAPDDIATVIGRPNPEDWNPVGDFPCRIDPLSDGAPQPGVPYGTRADYMVSFELGTPVEQTHRVTTLSGLVLDVISIVQPSIAFELDCLARVINE